MNTTILIRNAARIIEMSPIRSHVMHGVLSFAILPLRNLYKISKRGKWACLKSRNSQV